MKKTENTKATTNNDLQIINKKVEFVINNDENNEMTEKASMSFMEWLKTPQNSKKYIDRHGIIAGGWCISVTDVTEMYHIGTAYDALTGGMVDIIYLMFNNKLLNRIVYLDNEIAQRGSILLPIDDKIEYVPFAFKYTTARKKTPTKKSTTTKTENKTPKTNTKTNSTTTPKTTQKTDTKKSTTQKSTPTKTSTKTSTNTTEKVNK